MPSSGAFSVLRLRAPRLHRDESSVTTKNSKLHESIRIQAFAHRLELRLQTRDLRAHLAPELNLHVLRVPSTCFSLLRRIISLLRRNCLPVIVLFRVRRAPPNFAQPLVIQIDSPAKNRQFSLFSACYQGVSGRIRARSPLLITHPSSLPRKLGMEPRRLEMRECGSPTGEGFRQDLAAPRRGRSERECIDRPVGGDVQPVVAGDEGLEMVQTAQLLRRRGERLAVIAAE